MAKKAPNTNSYDASSLRDLDEYEGSLNSITNELGKQSDAYKRINANLKDTKALMGSIADKLEQTTDLEDKHKKQIEKAAQAYKESKKAIADAVLQYRKRNISQKEYNDIVIKSRDSYKEVVSQIDTGNKSAARTYKTFQKVGKELDAFAEAAEKSKKKLEGIESAVDQIGSSGVEGVRELGDVLKSAASGGKGLSLALGALAGTLAAMAYNYGLIGDKVGTVAKYDRDIAKVRGEIDVLNQQIDMGMFGGKNFVAAKAMAEFTGQLSQMGAQFQAASKTALFGKNLGGVGYGAAQLQLAGISAENIAEAMQMASDATGKMPSGKVAADMAIMAQRTGQSTESIASINELFQRLDKVSEKTALNLQEGVRAMADKAGVNLGSAMAEIAEASKDALSYQIKGSNQLAKQVIYAKSLGVSFNEVAKAGQNMVLNYKDSIKSEMSLSAMLGKNVNLSEVRAKFMSGDQEGAMKALQAQGLNPKDMNMFQQQALQQALGGMDLNSIQKISENTARSGGNLKQGNAGGANKGYLQAVQAREASLTATNAMISAKTQVELTKLNTAEEVQRQNALIKNVGGIADKTNNIKQLEALKDAETGLTTAIIALTAAIAVQMIPSLFKWGKSLLSPGAKVAEKATAKVATKTGAKATEKVGAKVAEKAAVKGGEKLAEKGAVKVAEKAGLKAVEKVGAKSLGKTILKKIPIVGALAGIGFALQRASEGDWLGAAGEVASGVASTIPGIGTAVSAGIDVGLAGRDIYKAQDRGSAPVNKEQQAKPIEKGTKPTVDAVNANGQKQLEAQKVVAEKARVTLTEAQYGTKLQQEMVAMLGLSTQILAKIMENTAGDKDITLDGKSLRGSLLNQARKNYGVARTA